MFSEASDRNISKEMCIDRMLLYTFASANVIKVLYL